MNAKIKELAEQANVLKYKVWEVGAITVTNAEDLERFAELIVRKCARMADCERNREPGKFILEQFGVEE